MSDIGDDFNALKLISQQKRSDNREQSAAILTRSGITFLPKNGGAHLVVLAGKDMVDFWPGTGLWIVRGETKKHRGVRKLIGFVEKVRGQS